MSQPKSLVPRHIERVAEGLRICLVDDLAGEEPLEIVVDGQPYAVTMRLPGDDGHLALGFLFTEGVIAGPEDVAGMRHCDGAAGENRLHVDLRRAGPRRSTAEPRLSVSSCGVCGAGSLERLRTDIPAVGSAHAFTAEGLFAMRDTAEAQQALFSRTGGTHFAALYDAAGTLLAFAEDLGRHNALDKVIGKALQAGFRRRVALALVSSRLSYEMVQKAGMLGVEFLAGMSVATSLAAELAESLGMTLVGRLRRSSCNIYCGFERVQGLDTPPAESPVRQRRARSRASEIVAAGS